MAIKKLCRRCRIFPTTNRNEDYCEGCKKIKEDERLAALVPRTYKVRISKRQGVGRTPVVGDKVRFVHNDNFTIKQVLKHESHYNQTLKLGFDVWDIVIEGTVHQVFQSNLETGNSYVKLIE